MSNKKINVFEAFSGIGTQHFALNNLKSKRLINYKIVGTSDWDIYAVQSYAAIHYPKYEKKIKNPNEEELNNFLKNFIFSVDGKKECKNMDRFSKESLIKLYKAFKVSNNIGSIVNSFDRVINDIILKNKSKIDLLTYSFPCQDLSTAGNFHGFNEGIKKHTRSGLLYEIDKLLIQLNKYKYNEKTNKIEEIREREREREREIFFLNFFCLRMY